MNNGYQPISSTMTDNELAIINSWKSAKEKHLERQVGGEHYKHFKIQPIEFCHINKIGYLEATAIKYLCRWRDKGGLEDLDKAIHYIQVLKELESANT